MSIVTMPFDFDTVGCARGLLPICISDTDADGHRITPRWMKRSSRSKTLCANSRAKESGTAGEVSELAELSVHAPWADEDLRCGGARCSMGNTAKRDHRLVVPQYPLSLRQLEEFMAEQNLSLDHVTSVPLPPHATCSVRVSALKQHPIVMLRRVLTEYAAYLHSERNHQEGKCPALSFAG